MLPSLRRIVAWPVLCGYLLAITASEAFHDHDHHHDPDHAAAPAGAGSDNSGTLLLRGLHGELSGDEDCAICQFLAQKSASAQPSTDTSWVHLWTPLCGPPSARILSRAPLVARNRDPPGVA